MADGTQENSDQTEKETWSSAMAPIISKFEVAAALGMTVSWNGESAKHVGRLIKEMARRLDAVVPEAIQTRDTFIKELEAENQRLTEIGLDAADIIGDRDAEISRLKTLVTSLGGNPEPAPKQDAT